ncbi:MAG: hypothetical protein QGG56_09055, partial [Dehalococcoidia bacterium]|nr:hypothetical protein [Dehalococcoidia bacterium]
MGKVDSQSALFMKPDARWKSQPTLLPVIEGSSASFCRNNARGPSGATSSGKNPSTSVASLASISARTASWAISLTGRNYPVGPYQRLAWQYK